MIAAFPNTIRVRALGAAALAALAACGGDDPSGVVNQDPVTSTGCVLVREEFEPGESVILPAGKNCIELTTPGTRFMVGVVHTGRTASSTAAYRLTGSVRGASASPDVGMLADVAPVNTRQLGSRLRDGDPAVRLRDDAHARLLDMNRSILSRYGAASRGGEVALGPGTTVAAAPTSGLRVTGDTATLRIPDIDAANACTKFFEVKARVAYASQRAIILEDMAAPLANQMNDTYRAIGDEFDTVMWPLLTEYFGDPTRLDATLDANGRIVMLFSPVINTNFENIAGFVIGCDFYTRAEAPSSNEAEVFYAMVPTSLSGSTNASESRDGWLRTMRSTLIHEAKHIVSFAERIAANVQPEDSWIEEGTARHAEELYARSLSGATWKGNEGYGPLYCEVRAHDASRFPECVGRPYVMYKHFDGLYDALTANGTRTPLGKADPDDFSFYASAWALIRWAADQAPDEKAFFKGLIRGPRSGIANIEAATGRTWEEIVPDWTMAYALDDYPGFTPKRAQYVASWNVRAVYAGINRDFPEFYAPYPTKPNRHAFGTFAVQDGSVRAGASALTELSGSWAGPQVLEIEAAAGGALPATSPLRLVVTRVQ